MNHHPNVSGTGHERYLELLPFLVNGTLDELDHARLQRHLRECADCRAALVEEQAFAACYVATAAPVPDPAPALARLLERLDRETPAGAAAGGDANVVLLAARRTERTQRALQRPYAVACALMLTLALGVLTVSQPLRSPLAPAYRTLADAQGRAVAAPGTLNVVFAPDLTASEIDALLAALPASTLTPRAQPGSYQVHLLGGSATRHLLVAAAARLRRQPGVLFAEPAPSPGRGDLR